MRILMSILLTGLLLSGSTFAACPCDEQDDTTTTTPSPTTPLDDSGQPRT